MQTFEVIFAQDVPQYAHVDIEAEDDATAADLVRMARAVFLDSGNPWEFRNPEYDSPRAERIVSICGADGVDRAVDVPIHAATSPTGPAAVREAIRHLKLARDLLKAGGATRAVDKVRLALTSAEGAERHALGKASRQTVPPAGNDA